MIVAYILYRLGIIKIKPMNNNRVFELKSALILAINHVDKYSNRELTTEEIKEALKQTTNHVQSINKQ